MLVLIARVNRFYVELCMNYRHWSPKGRKPIVGAIIHCLASKTICQILTTILQGEMIRYQHLEVSGSR